MSTWLGHETNGAGIRPRDSYGDHLESLRCADYRVRDYWRSRPRGEVRSVNHIRQRINEARKLGLARCLIPRRNLRDVEERATGGVIGVETVRKRSM
jgi:hypothetical protein